MVLDKTLKLLRSKSAKWRGSSGSVHSVQPPQSIEDVEDGTTPGDQDSEAPLRLKGLIRAQKRLKLRLVKVHREQHGMGNLEPVSRLQALQVTGTSMQQVQKHTTVTKSQSMRGVTSPRSINQRYQGPWSASSSRSSSVESQRTRPVTSPGATKQQCIDLTSALTVTSPRVPPQQSVPSPRAPNPNPTVHAATRSVTSPRITPQQSTDPTHVTTPRASTLSSHSTERRATRRNSHHSVHPEQVVSPRHVQRSYSTDRVTSPRINETLKQNKRIVSPKGGYRPQSTEYTTATQGHRSI